MLIETEFSLLSAIILDPLAPLTPLLLQEVEVEFGMEAVKLFLAEKILFSLEYLTTEEGVSFLVVVMVILLEDGMPTILLLCLLTWPMQPIFGDKGSVEKDIDRSSNLGRATSLIEGLEQSMGKNVDL